MPGLKKCEICNGVGKLLCPSCKEGKINPECKECNGTGFIICKGCMGGGWIDWPYIA